MIEFERRMVAVRLQHSLLRGRSGREDHQPLRARPTALGWAIQAFTFEDHYKPWLFGLDNCHVFGFSRTQVPSGQGLADHPM
jgi:hypothetical protein